MLDCSRFINFKSVLLSRAVRCSPEIFIQFTRDLNRECRDPNRKFMDFERSRSILSGGLTIFLSFSLKLEAENVQFKPLSVV